MGSRAVYEAVLIRRTLEAIGFEGFSFAPSFYFLCELGAKWVQTYPKRLLSLINFSKFSFALWFIFSVT